MEAAKPTLYIIHGFLGAGKSTFSKKLSGDTGAIRLNADDLCEGDFSPERLQRDWFECYDLAVAYLWQEAAKLLRNGQSTIMDLGFWTVALRKEARVFARKLDVEFRHYYLYAPDHVLLERIRKRGGDIAEHNIKKFDSLRSKFEPPLPKEDAIVITTG